MRFPRVTGLLVPVRFLPPTTRFPMIQSLRICAFAVLIGVLGCSPAKTPTGPAEGSVQEYLDQNPDVAARIDEGVDTDESDDGTGE